jgi:hypothetical protein
MDPNDLDFEATLVSLKTERTVFGRYFLKRELGRGGMGVVWLARDETLGVEVALKFLPDVVARDPEALAELKRETLRSRGLRHPGIVAVYEFVQDVKTAAIVMEYIDGTTLSQLKAEHLGGCYDIGEVAPWIEQLCAVLEYAHTEAKVVHRDLKPRNLMLTRAGRLKVADFGIAKSLSDSFSRVSVRSASSGTPPYMSPQQDDGEPPAVTDDIYGVGATIYDLLTSRPPFHSGNISRQIHEKVPPPMMTRRQELNIAGKIPIPAAWEETVAACLAKNSAKRPQAVRELAMRLEGSKAVPERPERLAATEREPKPLLSLLRKAGKKVALSVALAVCAAAVIGVSITHFGPKRLGASAAVEVAQTTPAPKVVAHEDTDYSLPPDAEVLAVNEGWNFVVLSAGDRQGIVLNDEMVVERDGSEICKVRITQVEPSSSVADIIPDSIAPGVHVHAGDRVKFPSPTPPPKAPPLLQPQLRRSPDP